MLIKVPGVRWAVQRVFRAQRSVTLGVRIVIVDDQQRVLLVRHGYTPGWHLPGGGVDRGESLHAAAVREANEETGVITSAVRLFGVYTNFEAFPGDHVAVFIADRFERPRIPASTFEIREQRFFVRKQLPEGTTAGTQRRFAEVFDGVPPALAW